MDISASWQGLNKFENGLRALGESRARRVMGAVLRETARHSKTFSKQSITAVYNIKSGDVAKTITSSVSGLEAKVVSRSPEIPLTKFRVRPPNPQPAKRPVISVEVVKGKQTPFKRAFVAIMKSGHKGVFTRSSTPRLPIVERKGIGPGQMMLSRRMKERIPLDAVGYYEKRLEGRILAALSGQAFR